jgi:Flp pilus assembly protein TadB
MTTELRQQQLAARAREVIAQGAAGRAEERAKRNAKRGPGRKEIRELLALMRHKQEERNAEWSAGKKRTPAALAAFYRGAGVIAALEWAVGDRAEVTP